MESRKPRTQVSLQLPRALVVQRSAPELRPGLRESCPAFAQARRNHPEVLSFLCPARRAAAQRGEKRARGEVEVANNKLRSMCRLEPSPRISRLNFFAAPGAPNLLGSPAAGLGQRGGGALRLARPQDAGNKDTAGRPASPVAMRVGRTRRTAMLDSHSYGSRSRQAGKGKTEGGQDVLESLHRLLQAQIEGSSQLGISTHLLAGLIGEVSAGMCTVSFAADGSLEREVVVQTVRILRPEDNHVLCQVGKWRPRHGLLFRCQFPGNKRPPGSDFSTYVQYLTGTELALLLGGRQVTCKGSSSETLVKTSTQFGVPTKYTLLVKHAVLEAEEPGGSPQPAPEDAPGYRVLRASPAEQGMAAHSGEQHILSGRAAHAVLRDHSEVDVYAWLPAALADAMGSNYAVKQSVQSWTQGFEDGIFEFATQRSDDSADEESEPSETAGG